MTKRRRRRRNLKAGHKRLIALAVATLAAVVFVLTGQDLDTFLNELYQAAAVSAPAADVEGDVKVHYIDVGQADCELIQTKTQNVLIDAGDIGGGDEIIDYLNAQGVEQLDILIATHPHADHIGGMADVVKAFDIGKIIFSEVPKSMTPTTKTYENLLDTIAEKSLKITKAVPGTEYSLGGGAVLTMLAPLGQYTEDINEYSVVCRLEFGESSFLFTGDASTESENDMLVKYGKKLQSDVLKLGHHGSSTATQEKWLNAVQPEIAVAEVGYDNKYGHPHSEVLKRLKSREIDLYRTDIHGSVVIGTDGKEMQITHGSRS